MNKQIKMVNIEKFIKEPYPNVLEIVKKKKELKVKGAMRKTEIVRLIIEHMTDNNIFGEEALDEQPVEITNMSAAQIELEKILTRVEIEKARMEQEIRLREIS